jgi:hypothetical protein
MTFQDEGRRTVRAIAIVLLALAVAIPAAACGGGGGQAGPEDAIRDFVRAANRDKPSEMYNRLSEECRQGVTLEEFVSAWGLWLVLYSDIGQLKAENVEVVTRDEDTATVNFDWVIRIRGEDVRMPGFLMPGDRQGLPLVKEHGQWRLANCEDFELFGSEE